MTRKRAFRACGIGLLFVIFLSIPLNPVTSYGPATYTADTYDSVSGINAVDNLVGIQEKLSTMGLSTDTAFDALEPAVAYNSRDHSFLVVWSGDDSTDGEMEIWGQRVDAKTMGQIGADFQISVTGAPGDDSRDAAQPDLAYNPATNEFLVVWSSDAMTDNRFEIFGRSVNGATGALVGPQFRFSIMLPDGDDAYDATNPAIAYNSTDNQFAIAWSADTESGSLVDDEREIWLQRVTGGGGASLGSNQRISTMGGNGDPNYDALNPDIAYNSTTNQYLVVWEGDDVNLVFQDDDYEIWGQCLDSVLAQVGPDDFLISDMGEPTPTNHWADGYAPAVTYNAATNQYLAVWLGDDVTDEKFDIYGQFINSNCYPIAPNDFQISHVTSGPNTAYDAIFPAVTWNALFNEYLVVWLDNELGVDEYEIWGQRMGYDATALSPDIRISRMGPDGDGAFGALTPAVAYSESYHNISLVTWAGDHSIADKIAIWSRRFGGPYKVQLPVLLR